MLDRLNHVNIRHISSLIFLPLRSPLYSTNFPASSNLRKSLVFCARSLRCTDESLWCATISEAVVSSLETSVDRSMPANALESLKQAGPGPLRTSPCSYYLLKLVVGVRYWCAFCGAIHLGYVVFLAVGRDPGFFAYRQVHLYYRLCISRSVREDHHLARNRSRGIWGNLCDSFEA